MEKQKVLTENEEFIRGLQIAEIFGLKKARKMAGFNDRYETSWGTKTALGLYRMVKRLADESNLA